MKSLLFAGITGVLLATPSWAAVTSQPTKTASSLSAPNPQVAKGGFTAKQALRPNLHSIHTRVRAQHKELSAQLKSGKISSEQAKTVQANWLSARKLELEIVKQNGIADLSASQEAQLNAVLDNNSSLLGEKTSSTAN